MLISNAYYYQLLLGVIRECEVLFVSVPDIVVEPKEVLFTVSRDASVKPKNTCLCDQELLLYFTQTKYVRN